MELDSGDHALAQRMYREWAAGTPKSVLERKYWDDGASHGQRFNKFILAQLGIDTVRRQSRKSGQLELDLSLSLIPDEKQRDEARELLSHSLLTLRAIADNPKIPPSASLLIETVIVPQLLELGRLLESDAASLEQHADLLGRAKQIVHEVIHGAQVVGAIGKDVGIATFTTMHGLAQIEPAMRGIQILMERV